MKRLMVIAAFCLLIFFTACSEENTTETTIGGDDPQKYTVSGKVTDQDGEGVSGATVNAIDNSSVGVTPAASATTGSDGSYSFQLDGGISYTIRVYYSDPNIPDDSETLSSLSSNQTVNFNFTITKEQTVSGTVTDVDGNPMEGLTVKLTLSTGGFNEVEKSGTTNSSGYYEILNDVKNYNSWKLEVVSEEYTFFSTESTSGFVMESDLTINFKQQEDYIDTWRADASGIPDSASSFTARALLRIDNNSLNWFEYDSNNDLVRFFNSANYTVTKSASGDIHEIRIPVLNQNNDLANDYRGIFQVVKSQPKWTFKIELIDILVDGNTAATAAGGFGSSNGGANGEAYVWTFLEN